MVILITQKNLRTQQIEPHVGIKILESLVYICEIYTVHVNLKTQLDSPWVVVQISGFTLYCDLSVFLEAVKLKD